MGIFHSRQDRGIEDVDISSSNTYGYPPKFGNYFSSHFIMGSEKFKTVDPESFLFGENCDLNFLNNKPAPFPYQPPANNEPSRTLRSLVHLRKDSLRLSRVSEDLESAPEDYKIEFTFDTDVACAVRIYLFAAENLAGGIARYTSKCKQSEPVFFQRGSNQIYNNGSFFIDPSIFSEKELQYQPGGSQNEAMAIPIVIQITVEEEEFSTQCEVTFATFEKGSDGVYSIKVLKQKIIADGICYIIQEIYGIENKNDGTKNKENDLDENGTECVICMSDTRDTLILPCRHLCLCNGCADSLRYQASNCPICRAPFHALLQIKAVRKKTTANSAANTGVKQVAKEVGQESEDYEEVPLVEALNGYLPTDAATGYSSRQSSGRRSRARNGSRPGSKKSRTGSRNGSRSRTDLPPVDKIDNVIIPRPCTASDQNTTGPKVMDVEQASIDIEPPNEEQNVADTTQNQEEKDGNYDELQESLQSVRYKALRDLIADNNEADQDNTDENGAEIQVHGELSLPGTPMGSDFSNQSINSIGTQRTISTTAGSGASIYSARIHISTPSNVNIEDS